VTGSLNGTIGACKSGTQIRAPLIDWTSQMAGFWQSRFDHLEDLLKRMDQ
jgi:hypothetical protein